MVAADRFRDALAGDLEAMLAETAGVVAIDSGSYDAAGVDAVSAVWADALAADGYAIARSPVSGRGARVSATLALGEGPKVLVVGHADTVWPAGTAAELPFTRDEAFAHGPGVGDMKGCVVMAIHALRAAVANGLDGIGTLQVLLVPDEELGSPDSRVWIEEHARGAGACLGLEAGWPGGGMVVARGAVGAIRVEAQGRTAHCAGDEDGGASAVAALAPLVAGLERLGRADGTSVRVGMFHGGLARQVVPDHAELHVDLRAPDAARADALMAAVRVLVDGVSADGVRVWLRGGVTRPAFTRALSDPLWALASARAAELGVSLRAETTRGGADVSFAAALGVPSLDGLGPICHDSCARTERIEIASLVDRGALFAALVSDLAERFRADGPVLRAA